MMSWRRWHRWLGTISGVLLILVGVTGVLLQIDEVGGITAPPRPTPVNPALLTPIDPVAAAVRVQTLVEQRHGGDSGIISLKIEAREAGPAAVIRFSGKAAPVEIDLRTGQEKAAEQPQRTLLQKIRLLVLNLHTFGLAGMAGHMVGMVMSVILVFLGGSGLWLWLTMLKERVKRNKQSWFWR